MTKAQQLSTALTILGFAVNAQQAEIVLELVELLNAFGDRVSLGDIQRAVQKVADKTALKQSLTLGKGGQS